MLQKYKQFQPKTMQQPNPKKNEKLEAMRNKIKSSVLIPNLLSSVVNPTNPQSDPNPELSQPSLSPSSSFSPSPFASESQQYSFFPLFNSISRPLLPKNLFTSQYTILEKLGEGANGIVHRCQHLITLQISAVKISSMQEQHIFTLKKINKILKKVNHPHILKMNEIYIDFSRHQYYQLMEYLPYPSLKKLIVNKYEFSNDEIRKMVKQLFKALQHLEEGRIVHRDIKTENLLYDVENQHLYVIDLGIITRTVERGRRRNLWTNTGTLEYKAPETLEGSSYNESVDVWAGGVVLFELVEKRTPFKQETQMDTIDNIVQIKYAFESEIWDKIPLAKDLVTRILKPKNERLRCSDILKNPWFQLMEEKDMELSPFGKPKSKLKTNNNRNPTGEFHLMVHSPYSTPVESKLCCSEEVNGGRRRKDREGDDGEIDGLELFRVNSENRRINNCTDPVGAMRMKDLFGSVEDGDVIDNNI